MRLRVEGGAPLKGTYTPSGSSNEAITLIAAALLTAEPIQLDNVPKSDAVRLMLGMAAELGATLTEQEKQLHLHTPRITMRQTHAESLHRPMASLLLQAPILARREHATLQWTEPLGRLHTHLSALRDLGVKIDIQGQSIHLSANRWQEQHIVLTETSVTTTALVCMLAAALGESTTIYNAASEPQLRSLQQFLGQMGVKIDGIGSNLLHIQGCPDGLGGAAHAVLPSPIEIASIAALAAMLPGHINIDPVMPTDLEIIDKVFERLGVNLVFEDQRLHIPEIKQLMISRRLEDVDVAIDTAPWPGFPSDLVAITTVLATQANGTTLIHEKLYNNRLLFVDKLKAMGAQIVLADPHRAVVIGRTPLSAEYMDSPDVRIGLALLGAALVADGESVIDRAEVIGQNFEDVPQKLIDLGAHITIEDA